MPSSTSCSSSDCFPAVVGSLTLKVGPQFREETSGLFGTYFSDTIEDAAESQVESSQVSATDELPQPIASLSDDDTEDDGQKTAIMQNCFAALVETLGNPSRPQESWAVFKQLYQLLQQKVQQQSRSHLTMEHISPVLASLKSTVIPMPGINKPSGVVTVQSVNNTVSILPTKTKPKKLAFMGSDGLRYTYLFKGLEDLHLDERIMQFLSIVNNMFAKNKRHGKQVYYARHYSVTPLGPRSGLIQWVDGATPLFGVYKRWQQREASASVTKGQNSNGNATILRPSEIFYNKLTPLLKEKNINSLDNRKEWPLSVLLDVLKQLMSETLTVYLLKNYGVHVAVLKNGGIIL
ncbi:hypothetical protein CEXT_276061 [Caerostris extrusa]|uniref:PI3K/PI4K catalytic domain-containing protein n=1 Tax=Caerostris extrusa TaxID=172846 RepID=A0AAV4Y0L1_CAEEX|nr:hypothetical protein CEXT_276061 [Caerostris extrusa]